MKPSTAMSFTVAISVLSLANLTLHLIATYILVCLYKSGKKTVQKLYLINLSVTEILASLAVFGQDGMRLLYGGKLSPIEAEISLQLCIAMHIVFCIYFWNMIFITADRLFATVLHVKYPIYWNKEKAKWAIKTIWLLGVVICVLLSMINILAKTNFREMFINYIYPSCNVFVIVLVLTTYNYIHRMHVRRCRRVSPLEFTRKTYTSSAPKIYVVVLLVSSFLIFMGLPSLIYLVYRVVVQERDFINVENVIKLFYQLSFLSDSSVYVFLQRDVRRLLLKKVGFKHYELNRRTVVSRSVVAGVTIEISN